MNQHILFSTKALVVEDERFLAVYKWIDGKQQWDLPGGCAEFGEEPEETLKREVMEELGLRINPIKLVDTWSYRYCEEYHVVGVIYLSELSPGEIVLSKEHDGYEWISIDQMRDKFSHEAFVNRISSWKWESVLDRTHYWK